MERCGSMKLISGVEKRWCIKYSFISCEMGCSYGAIAK